MKYRLTLVLFACILVSGITSCSGGWRIEKRIYNKGFYIARSHGTGLQKENDKTGAGEIQQSTAIIPQENSRAEPKPQTESGIREIHKQDTVSGSRVVPDTKLEPRDTITNNTQKQGKVHSPVKSNPGHHPELVKWVFLIALVLAVALLIIAPGLFYPWYFLVNIPGFVPVLLWIAALVLSIYARRTGKKRAADAATAEEKNYNLKWSKRAGILALILAGILFVFVAVLVLAIIALASW